jgi:integrase
MVRGRPGTGVEPLKSCIRVRFTWNGKRQTETLKLKPTPPNIKAAERMMAEIKQKISLGVFNYAQYFPKSPSARMSASYTPLKVYVNVWLRTLSVEHSTYKLYKSAMDQVWVPALGNIALADIVTSDVATVVADRRAQVSAKTINNDLIPLRSLFETAIGDNLITNNPAARIRNLRHQSEPPDPFSAAEAARIVAHLHARHPEQAANYFEFAFLSGLRTSELIALHWSKIDWTRNEVRVDTARVRGLTKGTKTARVRDVELTVEAMAVLHRQKKFTFLQGADGVVFKNPATNQPWANDSKPRETHFHPALKALGLRQRDAYQTRHTYATISLMAGQNPAYIASQLGHANSAMVFKVYARWIPGADNGKERAKIDGKFFGQRLPTKDTK